MNSVDIWWIKVKCGGKKTQTDAIIKVKLLLFNLKYSYYQVICYNRYKPSVIKLLLLLI